MRSSSSSRAKHIVLEMLSSSRGSPALVPVPYDSYQSIESLDGMDYDLHELQSS